MVGTVIASYVLGAAAAGTFAYAAMAFAINLVASSIISKSFAPNINNADLNSLNPGNPQQQPPASDNKLPVVYGTGWVGGIVTDLSITNDNQVMYYVLALSECTQSPDTITFGDVFFGGKKCVFFTNATITASCSGTTLVTSASDTNVKVGMTVLSSTGISLGQITADLGTSVPSLVEVHSWTVSIGGTYASQSMTLTDTTRVSGLLDESTGLTDTSVNGFLNNYL